MGQASKRLARARKTRRHMSSALADVESGKVTLADALARPSRILQRVRVYDVVRRAPYMGPEKTKKVLLSAHIWPYDTLGSLSAQERARILEHLPKKRRDQQRATPAS